MQEGFPIGSDPVGIHTGAEQYPPADVEDKNTQRGGVLLIKGSQWDRSAGIPDHSEPSGVGNLPGQRSGDQDKDPNGIDPALASAFLCCRGILVREGCLRRSGKDPNGIDPVQHPPPSPADGSDLPTQKRKGSPHKGQPPPKNYGKNQFSSRFPKALCLAGLAEAWLAPRCPLSASCTPRTQRLCSASR